MTSFTTYCNLHSYISTSRDDEICEPHCGVSHHEVKSACMEWHSTYPVFLQVRVVEARDLPVMDSRSELTDAYVEVKFGDDSSRTPVCRKTLCPVWNADFRFELEDNEIQDETLEIKCVRLSCAYFSWALKGVLAIAIVSSQKVCVL